VEIVDGQAVVRWPACDAVAGQLGASYRVVEEEMAVDATFTAHVQAPYGCFELFIASYFTPFYTPRYAVRDNRTHPDGVFWYTKQWYGPDECESWARDQKAEAVFADGRWQSGYPLNWRRGPHFAHPLMTQEHRYGHAVLLMARPQDCCGISGFNSYHNAQYFHLFGEDVVPGQAVSATIRMVLLTEWEDLQEEALARYKAWVGDA
jgi:hypothetical protein